MKVTVRNVITWKLVTRELPVTPEQIQRWQSGELIQNVFPHLSPSDREFLMTGLSDEEFDEATADLDDPSTK